MSRKGITIPPPRPPAPKVGGSGGLSFSFKALEEEDEDELTFVTGKFDKQVHDEKERQARNLERDRSMSKSPESLRQTSEGSMSKSPSIKSQNSFDKLKDLKDKIQTEIQKKKDGLFTDTNVASVRDKDMDQSTVSTKKDLDNQIRQSPVKHIEQTTSVRDDTFDNVGTDVDKNDDETFDMDTEYFDTKSEEFDESYIPDNDDDILEINESYFNPMSEDFSDLPGVIPIVRQRKRFQKLRKIKPIIPPAPVSMSKLNEKLPVPEPDDTVNTDTSVENKVEKSDLVESESVINVNGAKIPVKTIVGGIIFLFLYMILPLPSYISGMIAGGILASGGWMLYLWIIEPPKPREIIPPDPPLEELPPLPTPEIKEPKGEDGCFKGWMNELLDYQSDTYSINQTHSVYVHLEGTTLRLRRPKINVPKRAMWDEPNPNPQFIHQRHFNIEGSKVSLLPAGLVKKRLWSKKYPICVALASSGKKQVVKQDSTGTSDSNGSQTGSKMSSSHSTDSVQGFEFVSEQKCDSSVLYLFARTCREKEQWYKRLVSASQGTPLKNHILEIRRLIESSLSANYKRSGSTDSLKHKRQNSSDSLSSVATTTSNVDETSDHDLKQFVLYMSRLIPRDKDSNPATPVHGSSSAKEKDTKTDKSNVNTVPGSKGIICEPVLRPLNAILGRCFWDFLGDQYWADKVKDKLQKKLSKIHIPYFIEELQIKEISLGTETPVIRRANSPYLDEDGFWMDLDITYSGRFKMTIETKVNLLKLKTVTSKSTKQENKKSAITDSEEEDSAESSTDEDDEPSNLGDDSQSQSGGTGKKIMKYINKIAASKYFQSATENKFIKKAMTEVSNTPLILTVEVQKLCGTLAINVPPPPSDRLWYGFRGNPQLWLVAKPKVGEREVTMSHITDWIEKKLALEFQHVLVMPNMDDLVIPILMPFYGYDPSSPEAAGIPNSDSGSAL
ncbi:Tabersonine 6 [Mactra antiquata]